MTSDNFAFEFVKIDMPPEKPREVGVIEFRGPYYAAVSYGYLKDLLDDWAFYVDGYKFAGGSMRLLPSARVKQIIQICHDYKLYVSTGGFVERVIVQGGEAVISIWRNARSLGLMSLKCQAGSLLSLWRTKLRLLSRCKSWG